MKHERSDRIAIVTVHGTGDTAPSLAGDKWFQQGAALTERLKTGLKDAGVEADIVPHLWSGANSAADREAAANRLANAIKKLDRTHAGVHVIGHSHGGNVANEAADYLRWGRKSGREPIASLITVGTPFFKMKKSFWEILGGMVFLALTILSAVAIGLVGLVILTMLFTGELTRSADAAEAAVRQDLGQFALAGSIVFAILGAELVATVFMIRLAFQGARRILRPRGKAKASSIIYAIWHPNDEAISFLQKVEQMIFDVFPKGTFYRGSRTPAIVWGVRIILAIAALGVWGVTVKATGVSPRTFLDAAENNFDPIPDGIVWAVLCTPLIFSAAYFAFRTLFGLAPEHALRGRMNAIVADALRAMAFGKDGDHALCDVSEHSHTHPTRSVKLEGEVADRMQVNAKKAGDALIEKYRWSLFSVGSDSSASLNALATDAMTWDSLIHTTYFDQPEVADLIVGHILERHAERAAAPAPKTIVPFPAKQALDGAVAAMRSVLTRKAG